MASDVVKVSRKHVFGHNNKSNIIKAPEKHSLINPDQPLSSDDSHLNNTNINNIIPKGFVAVYVGPHQRRFVIPTRFLSVPDFKAVMETAAEEFGYQQQGGLRIPCDEDDFQKLLAACKFKSKSNSSHIHTDHYCRAIPISN